MQCFGCIIMEDHVTEMLGRSLETRLHGPSRDTGHTCVYKPQLTAPQSTLVLMQNWAFVYSTESHASLK